jgi:tetratricopeptide (TPR) repeat protein
VFVLPGLFVGNADGAALPVRNAAPEAVVFAPARPARPLPPAPQAPLRSGEFLVIEPKKKVAPAAPAEAPAAVAAANDNDRVVPVARPVFAFDPFAPAWVVEAEKREADPKKEVARLLKLGREAFAAGEYGRAAEAFERAAAVGPGAAEPRFLKAQAAFAAGTYADAVAAIRAGLLLEPHWPERAFDPKEPYGANAAAFARHLAELRKAVAANPDEPTLAFLLGYQLWFIGEKAEAKRWLGIAAGDHPPAGLLALFR